MRGARVVMQVKQALKYLNPSEVRDAARLPVTIEIGAASPEMYEEIEQALLGNNVTAEKRADAKRWLRRAGESGMAATIRIYEESMPHREGTFLYRSGQPRQVIREVLAARQDLSLALARRFPAFRQCVVSEIIKSVSKENALFSLATAVPSMVPFLSLPYALGEFASDTAFLTMNQVRMAFLLAGASDRDVGYRDQKAEIGSIVAGAFGWRALARELAGKIPMGGGLIPKAAIAYAGTFVAGQSLDRYYRLGYGFTPSEREKAYTEAFARGKAIASQMLDAYRSKQKTA
ncbi:MAG TPA: hypothetical protein VFL57_17115 [Bryobacteraceae bacterium]|nr:hypothetical protein [Bryobacteraceae bacterium]